MRAPSLTLRVGLLRVPLRFSNPFTNAKGSAKPFASLTPFLHCIFYLIFSFSSAQNFLWNTIATYPGPEDITWNSSHNIAFISCDERRKNTPFQNQNGKILGYCNNQILSLHAELPFPFHPHGIDFEENLQHLYVINHRKKKFTTIEIFQFDSILKQIHHLKTIESSSFKSPNDLHVIKNETFYFTNDPNGRSFLYLLFHFVFRLKTDKVIYYDNGNAQTFCKMNYPNGIVQIDNQIFISSIYKRRIEVYDLKGEKIKNIPLDSAPDNLEIDENKNLWTATHVNFTKFVKHFKDSTYYSPSKIYQIIHPSSNNHKIMEIQTTTKEISAASVAAPFQNTVLVGCVFDKKIFVGTKK